MSNYQSTPIISNCIFTQNEAKELDGGGLRINQSSPVITNCVIWNNSPDEIDVIGSLPTTTYCDIHVNPGSPIYPGTGNISADPRWVNPGSGDFHLKPDSPCIDSGTNSAIGGIAEDFEGDDRILDGDHDGTATIDMGIDEAVTTAVEVTVALQGDHRPEPEGWEIPICVGFYPIDSGTDTILNPGSAMYYYSGTTSYSVTAAGTRASYKMGLFTGIYDMIVDSSTTLLNVKRGVSIF